MTTRKAYAWRCAQHAATNDARRPTTTVTSAATAMSRGKKAVPMKDAASRRREAAMQTRDQIVDIAENGVFLGIVHEIAEAIEAEVRKQDEALIGQMLEVLEYVRNTPEAEYDSKAALSKAQAAITAARARLGAKT